MTEKILQLTKRFAGWFETSFWVDVHYGLAALATMVVIVVYASSHKFDIGFAGFVTGMWTTAVANDKINMPAEPSAPAN